MNLALLPLSAAIPFVALILWCAYQACLAGFSFDGPAKSVAAFKPCFFVSGAWLGLLYTFLFVQSFAAFSSHSKLKKEAAARGERGPSLSDVKYSRNGVGAPFVRVMDRTVGNLVEQSLPFLLGMYGYALLVSPGTAAAAGWLWLLFRSYYPIVYQMRFPAKWDDLESAIATLFTSLLSAVMVDATMMRRCQATESHRCVVKLLLENANCTVVSVVPIDSC
ncbi:MAG: hypothetical protein SGPRY_010233 [Prymnesium sp.]